MRLDVFVSDHYKISRNRAQFAIDSWKVLVNGILIKKPWYKLTDSQRVELTSLDEIHYVARSAFKLKWLLDEMKWDFHKAVCLDIGASTWWFTQVLLEHDVEKVCAVDVGTLQLHEKIRQDMRVESFENTDIRDFALAYNQKEFDYIFCDVSFIRLELILESVLLLKRDHTKVALLYKPQYEVGKNNLTKLWVPKSQDIIDIQLEHFCLILKEKWVKLEKIIPSVLEWENGNKEYFVII